AEILLNSRGFEDLANRAEMVGRIEQADADLAQRVRSLRNQVQDALAAVKQAKAEQDAYNARVADARDQIAQVRANAEAQAPQPVLAESPRRVTGSGVVEAGWGRAPGSQFGDGRKPTHMCGNPSIAADPGPITTMVENLRHADEIRPSLSGNVRGPSSVPV